MWCFFCWSFLLFVFRVCFCHTVLFVLCCVVVACWKGLTSLLMVYGVFLCFCNLLYEVLGLARYLIILIPDICLFLICFSNSSSLSQKLIFNKAYNTPPYLTWISYSKSLNLRFLVNKHIAPLWGCFGWFDILTSTKTPKL